MAVAFTKMAAGPNILKYKITAAGAESGDLLNATLLADCALKAGSPLYDILAASRADQAAARAVAFDRTDIKVSLLSRDADAAWVIDADVVANALKLTATAAAADALGSYLTIEYRHSMVR